MIPLFYLLGFAILGYLGFSSYLITKFVFNNIKKTKNKNIETEPIKNIDVDIEKDLQLQLKLNSLELKDKTKALVNTEENQEGIPYSKYTF